MRDTALDDAELHRAVEATFARRQTTLPSAAPIGLSDAFASDETKRMQWRAVLNKNKLLFDFTDPLAADAWRAIDDRVMGGISRSCLRHDLNGHAVFEGEVSLERNGGFASVRSSPGARGMAGAGACLVEARGEAKRFKLSLITDDRFDSVNYQAVFTPTGGTWHTLRLPLEAFRATFRGREVPGAQALDPSRIRQVGLMITDRQAGPFALDIRHISLA